jgi:DNA-directed RNA polymerase specialized sigma24 family protein
LTFRGCANSEDLADETIDRVARKVRDIAPGYVGDPALYFYGVAQKVYLEYLRSSHAVRSSDVVPPPLAADSPGDSSELVYRCLESCLENISASNRMLITEYYRDYKSAKEKIDRRKELASRMGVAMNALMVRVHRIKSALERCITECADSTRR